jgi:hypothetical protein
VRGVQMSGVATTPSCVRGFEGATCEALGAGLCAMCPRCSAASTVSWVWSAPWLLATAYGNGAVRHCTACGRHRPRGRRVCACQCQPNVCIHSDLAKALSPVGTWLMDYFHWNAVFNCSSCVACADPLMNWAISRINKRCHFRYRK